jgi:hypothetical protein
MRRLRWILFVILFMVLITAYLPVEADGVQSPGFQTDWIDIAPPNGFSAGFAYPPINNRTEYHFRVNTLNGSPGYWRLWVTPESDSAAYQVEVWAMDASGNRIPGPSGGGKGDCGDTVKAMDVLIPNAEGAPVFLAVKVKADFIVCNPGDPDRMTAISNFSLGWSYLGDSPPPTETPTPTISPTPGPCNISLTASPSHIPPGGNSTISLSVTGANSQPLSGAMVNYDIISGPGMVGGGKSETDAQGQLEFEYQSPQDVGGAMSATIEVRVSGCEAMATSQIYFGATSTPTITDTPTETPVDGIITIIPTITPSITPSKIPSLGDDIQVEEISIERIVLVQGIEGGALVGGRAIGVRVYFNLPSGQSLEMEVAASVDGIHVVQNTKILNRKRYFDLFLPANISSWGQDQQHTLDITATLLNVGGRKLNPSPTAVAQETFNTYRSRPLTLLYVSIDPFIGTYDINDLASKAKNFFDQVYPIPYSVRVRNAAFFVTPPVRVGLTKYISAANSVEQARRHYNAQRCQDTAGNPISPCTAPRADYAVGIFRDGAYGADTHGFAYRLFRHIWRAALNNESNPYNVSHEIGHLYDFGEEYTNSVDGITIPSGLHYVIHGSIRVHQGHHINFMGRAGNSSFRTWVNPHTWNLILTKIQGANAVNTIPKIASMPFLVPEIYRDEIDGKAFMVAGVLDRSGKVEIQSVDLLHRYEPIDQHQGEFLLQALDGSGNVVVSTHFDVAFSEQYGEEVVAPFLVILPVTDPDQVAELWLLRGKQQVASLVRSPSTPTVSFDPLPKFSGEKVTLGWTATDADGDPLRSTLFYSSDGGQVWQVVGVNLDQTQVEIDPAILSGGQGQFKVIVADGLNEAYSVSDIVTLPDQAPIATIELPWGDSFAAEEAVYLTGYGYDLEDGEIPNSQLRWKDGEGKEISHGSVLEILGLPEGEHQFVLTVVDSLGHSSQEQVTISILPPEEGEGILSFLAREWKSAAFILGALGWVLNIVVLLSTILFFKGQTWAKAVMIGLVFLLFVLTVAVGILGVMVFSGDGLKLPTEPSLVGSNRESGVVISTPLPDRPIEEFQAQALTSIPKIDPTRTPTIDPTPEATPIPPRLPDSWQIVLVDPGEHVGEFPSIALDPRGMPHISYSYYTTAGPDPDYDLRAAHYEGTDWFVETIDAESVRGWFTSLAYDSKGHPHIAYYDVYGGDVRYAYHDGVIWQKEAIDLGGKVGYYASLALDSLDQPHVSYWFVDEGDVRYGFGGNVSGELSWNIQDVDQEDNIGENISLALDSKDRPHISYYDRTHGDLKYAYMAESGWIVTVVDSTGDVGIHTSIEADQFDHVHIAYFDYSNADLKYANFDGENWLITTVDSDGNVGRSAALTLDSFGRPFISYYDLSNYNLKIALFDGSTWLRGVVGPLGTVRGSEGTSLVLDNQGCAHIAYYTLDGLTYAYSSADPVNKPE